MSTIDQLTAKALQQIADAGDLDALDALRVALLGKSGEITLQLKQLGTLAPEQRKLAGEAINRAKDAVADAVAVRKLYLERAALDQRGSSCFGAVAGGWSAIRLLQDAAVRGELDPWDVDVIAVVDGFLDQLRQRIEVPRLVAAAGGSYEQDLAETSEAFLAASAPSGPFSIRSSKRYLYASPTWGPGFKLRISMICSPVRSGLMALSSSCSMTTAILFSRSS